MDARGPANATHSQFATNVRSFDIIRGNPSSSLAARPIVRRADKRSGKYFVRPILANTAAQLFSHRRRRRIKRAATDPFKTSFRSAREYGVLQVCKKWQPRSLGKRPYRPCARAYLPTLFSPPGSHSNLVSSCGINWVTARLLSLRGSVHAADYAFVSRYTFFFLLFPTDFLPYPFFTSSFFFLLFFIERGRAS